MGDLHRGLDNLERILDGSKRPGKLKLSVLSNITKDFSDERKIGRGGCGDVYKGILPSGRMVAVKKLFSSQTTDERMFEREVTTMMSVEHPNIVRFIGYCSHTEQQVVQLTRGHILADERERLLCLEYIRKGTLGDHLTDELRGLEWHTRFQIIKGICEGLHHLKEKNIIHMDLKPANILLNDDLVPKITDFGISRPGEISETVSPMYTRGYCAPEYLLHGKMSFKSDIYSLGVIIIEIVTGARENNLDITIVCRRWRHRWYKSGKHTTILGWQQQVTRCLELAQRCKNWNPTERPDIHDLICELSKMDSTCMDISDSCISTVEQKKSFLEDMLGIEPLELHLCAQLKKQISHSIQLTNDTDDYVAFRIPLEEENMDLGVSGTSRLPFCMHPNKDIVSPRSSCSVTIKLEALKKPLQEHCVAKLCVQSARVDKGLTTKDITADMFKEKPDKMVDVVNLMVSVRVLKQLLVVEPLELRYYRPIKPNKLLPCSLQLTNRTDDYVAFTLILPQGKELIYYQARMGTGIVPPCSTWGLVIDMLVEEEALAETIQCKDTCLLRSVVVDADLRDDDVSVEFFNQQTDVQEIELDIVFAEQPPQALPPLISPLSIETELLHIHPVELSFAAKHEEKFISLTNKTDVDILYVINDHEGRDIVISDYSNKFTRGEVLPHSTCIVPRFGFKVRAPFRVRVIMISGSHRDRTAIDLIGKNRYHASYKRENLMNIVREYGGKVHEALLACFMRAPPHPEHEMVVLRMDENGLGGLSCMDVHPKEPWVVTGHLGGIACVWKIDPETSASQTMMSTSKASIMMSVKFIARMQWVACGDYDGYITVYTYADNTLTEIKEFQAEEGSVHALAVHPSLPYLLSASEASNFIQLWDWDQGWMCTRKFSCQYGVCEMTFNPKDANTFASLDKGGEINIWNIDSQERPTTCLSRDAAGIAYCNTGSDLQCLMATVICSEQRKIEILDLWSNTTTHINALEQKGWLPIVGSKIACHPTRPLLATTIIGGKTFLWNYTTHGLKKVGEYYSRQHNGHCVAGFIDMEGFQRVVIPHCYNIELVDILI